MKKQPSNNLKLLKTNKKDTKVQKLCDTGFIDIKLNILKKHNQWKKKHNKNVEKNTSKDYLCEICKIDVKNSKNPEPTSTKKTIKFKNANKKENKKRADSRDSPFTNPEAKEEKNKLPFEPSAS